MRDYRLYENLDPDAELSADDMYHISRVNEKMRLDNLFNIAKKDLIKKGLGKCRDIKFLLNHDENLEVTCYYDILLIIEKLLFNSVKADATNINVYTSVTDKELIIKVEDNGIGFDANKRLGIFASDHRKKDNNTSHGMYNIKKALINAKGHFAFESSPQSGTVYTVKFPLDIINLKMDNIEH